MDHLLLKNAKYTTHHILSGLAIYAIWGDLASKKTLSKIQGFSKLQDGWYYGEGVSFSSSAIQNAVELLETINQSNSYKTDAFPGPTGDIMVCVYASGFSKDKYYLQFIVKSNGELNILLEINQTKEYRETKKNIIDAKTFLEDFGSRLTSNPDPATIEGNFQNKSDSIYSFSPNPTEYILHPL